jgi:hypothetical protein
MSRALQELALFWNDARTRTPRRSLLVMLGVTICAALIGAAYTGASTSTDMTSSAAVAMTSSPVVTQKRPTPVKCERQVWPYLDDTCLRHDNAGHSKRDVRVIALDRDAAATTPSPQAEEPLRRAKTPHKSRPTSPRQ